MWKAKPTSNKQYLFGLLLSKKNAKKTLTEEIYSRSFSLSLKRNDSQTCFTFFSVNEILSRNLKPLWEYVFHKKYFLCFMKSLYKARIKSQGTSTNYYGN